MAQAAGRAEVPVKPIHVVTFTLLAAATVGGLLAIKVLHDESNGPFRGDAVPLYRFIKARSSSEITAPVPVTVANSTGARLHPNVSTTAAIAAGPSRLPMLLA